MNDERGIRTPHSSFIIHRSSFPAKRVSRGARERALSLVGLAEIFVGGLLSAVILVARLFGFVVFGHSAVALVLGVVGVPPIYV